MSVAGSCPRCGAELRPPGLMSSAWRCATHGEVAPFQVTPRLTPDSVSVLAAAATVPVWSPLPLLAGWTLTGTAKAGDERTRGRAVVTAFAGPSPLGGPADLLLIAEEPGVGVGARFAGIDALDPGAVADGVPDAKIEAGGHPTALWRCDSAPDRVAFAGEAAGVWLYAVLWPPAAELVLLEQVVLHDLRDPAHRELVLPLGAPSPRLR